MNDVSLDRQDKFRRYRDRKRAMGLREYRLWGSDLQNPDVLRQLQREGEILRHAPEELEAADFIEAVMADTMKDHPY